MNSCPADFAAMLYPLLIATVFGTAVLSGVLGMAGGLLLMLVLVSTLSVANAMLLHGAVQATSNGSRSWFLRRHIRWSLLPRYCIGAFAALLLFSWLMIVPAAGVVLILVGLFPWVARVNKHLAGLDVTRPLTTVTCGFVVTIAQLLAGASGPLLDVFYLNAKLTRQEIVANKAVTQTIGHMIKIVYYGAIVALTSTLPLWLFVAGITAAVAGTRIGTWLLAHWDDSGFRQVTQYVILTLATYCIAQGVWMLSR